MLHGYAVRCDHHSRAIRAAFAVDKNLCRGVRANQVEKLHNLGIGWLVAPTPWNADVFESKRLDFALLGRNFSMLIAEIYDYPHAHLLQRFETRRCRLAAAVERIGNAAPIRKSL